MDIVEFGPDDSRLPDLYATILRPSFPPTQLIPLTSFTKGLANGSATIFAAYEGDRPVAVATGEWSPDSRVQLLAYLAVRPDVRGSGLGGQILEHALDRWRRAYQPCVILAEVELPAAHGANPWYGDPAARMRFYANHGARALELPYFQPGLGGPAGRCYGMALLSLYQDAALAGDSPDSCSSAAMRVFLTEYLTLAEGSLGTDPAVAALFAALDRAQGCRLLSLDELARLPVSTPDGPRPQP